jgi:class 3 adenylate cyclase
MLLNHPALARILRLLASVGLVCAVLAVAFRIPGIRPTTVTSALIVAVILLAAKRGRWETTLASLAAAYGFETYFEPPIGEFGVKDLQGWLAVIAMFLSGIVVSYIALQARKRAADAVQSKLETERLYELGQAMLASDSLQATAYIAVNRMVPIFGAKGAAFYLHGSGEVHRAGAESGRLSDEALRDAVKAQAIRIDAGEKISIIPVWLAGDPVGSLGFIGISLSDTVMKSIGSLLSVVLERVKASEKLVAANQELERRHHQVEEQKRTSESLLLNILPAEVADELRTKGMVSPKYFEDVTILFTDFVGFTLATEKLAAEDLVQVLNEYFTAFDHIVTRYGLEKMKTIGDSYMCLSGLPIRNPAHPVDTVMAAFEMLEVVKNRSRSGSPFEWKVRIGIHTGPVIAGVVGINKFAFDIWGDTVNYSSRMESSGHPNRINLSERTYSRVKDFFVCEYRGKVATKEKKELDMYFANGLLPSLWNGDGKVPPEAFVRRYNVYFQKDPPAFPAFLTSCHDVVAVGSPVGSPEIAASNFTPDLVQHRIER